MFNLIKKDFLTISRDRSEVLILLVMPLILISILGFALGGLMEGEEGIKEIPIAIVMENDFESDVESLQDQEIRQVIMNFEDGDPAKIFMDIMTSPELEEIVELRTDYNSEEARDAILRDEIAAIITIPEGFSLKTLMGIYFEEDSNSAIELLVQDKEQFRAGIIENILNSFIDEYNLEVSILQATGGVMVESEVSSEFGKVTYLPTLRPVSSFQYYTMGMALMFALYVASTVSSNAFKEKTSHVFARLMLTGERPLGYLLSKGISATVLSILQLMILFLVSALVFKTFNEMSLESLVGMGVLTLIFSLTIGSLATLLTSIALQFNDDAVSGIFSGFVVSAFGFIGGSMLPVEQFSPLLRELGNWTPNGAMMTAYLQLIQGLEFGNALPMIYRVIVMMIIFIILAVSIFPKRRLT